MLKRCRGALALGVGVGLRGAVRPESTNGAGKFANPVGSPWDYVLFLPRGERLDLLAVFLSRCLLHVGGGGPPWLLGIVCLCMDRVRKGLAFSFC